MAEEIEEGEFIATLVFPDDYAKHPNQIASLSTQRLIFIKRKELAMTPYEIQHYSMRDCQSISYRKHFALVPMLFGLASLLLILVIFIGLSDVEFRVRVPIGAMAAVVLFGAILFRGPIRHRIIITFPSRTFRWQSRAGEFRMIQPSVEKVLAFARREGLLRLQS